MKLHPHTNILCNNKQMHIIGTSHIIIFENLGYVISRILVHSINQPKKCTKTINSSGNKFTSTHHKDTGFCLENPNWEENHRIELDLIKHYDRNYKKLRFPSQISPT